MVVLDVETTGLDPLAHSILSIGALILEDPTNQFYGECRVWEGAEIDDGALGINGFTKDQIMGEGSGKQSEAELITAFMAWVEKSTPEYILAAQNPSFDLEFTSAACARAGIDTLFAKRTVDVHSVTWLHMQQQGIAIPLKNGRSAISLDTALVHVGVPEEPKPHNALTGACAHAEVLSRIAYTKKLLPQFSTFDIPWTTNT